MKKVSAIVLAVVMVLSLFCLTGCSPKVSLTAEDFKTTMEAKGFTVKDVSEQVAENPQITKAYVAISGDEQYQIEFYETDTAETAQRLYAGNKVIFEESASGASSNSSASAANYNSFKMTADGYYKVLSRIDNTLIYVNAPKEYKDEIKTVLDEIGY